MAIELHEFDSNAVLSENLAECIASALEGALNLRDRATLAVSGGSTPKPLFAALSRCELDWSRVSITQVDERWVEEDHSDSNARLVREHLLQNNAAAAHFISMKLPGTDAFAAEQDVRDKLAAFAESIDVVVLGMGDDGHTASFFPAADTLAQALDPAGTDLCLAVRPPVAPHDRMTLSLPALLAARQLYLHITGENKYAVLQQALAGDDVMELPIRSVFQRADNPLQIFYAAGS
ncbi:MAG: 6-phosphogluconolactonase [Halieaceae bacterium]